MTFKTNSQLKKLYFIEFNKVQQINEYYFNNHDSFQLFKKFDYNARLYFTPKIIGIPIGQADTTMRCCFRNQ